MSTATKAKAILMCDPMVRSILEGRKTQTRRVVKPQPNEAVSRFEPLNPGVFKPVWNSGPPFWTPAELQVANKCVYSRYVVGDILWVRETWAKSSNLTEPDSDCIAFRADGAIHEIGWHGEELWGPYGFTIADLEREQPGVKWVSWRPSIHMPRWAARLFLRVTDVRVQRVQEISEEDCIAEGIDDGWLVKARMPSDARKYCFLHLWDDINLKRAPWESNPWVFAYTFERIAQP